MSAIWSRWGLFCTGLILVVLAALPGHVAREGVDFDAENAEIPEMEGYRRNIRPGFEDTEGGYKPIVGIDLGTTYSCATIFDSKGNQHTIKDEMGKETFPSVVYFAPDGSIEVGRAAKQRLSAGDGNVLYAAKRLIGGHPGPHLRKFLDSRTGDIKFCDNRKTFYMKVAKPVRIPSKVPGEKDELKEWYRPEEVSAQVLKYIKNLTENYIGRPVANAVITVPANFENSPREATRDAGMLAGLKVLKLLHEPTAGAIAYGLDKISKDLRNALVFDLGGGTSDFSQLAIEDGVFEVKHTDGDNFLGGDDIDSNGVAYVAAEISKKYDIPVNRILEDYARTKRLKAAFEEAKIELSTVQSTDIDLPEFVEDKNGNLVDCVITLTQPRLIEIAKPTVEKMVSVLEGMLRKDNINVNSMSDIIAIGGTTKMPYVLERFGSVCRRKIEITVSPDMAVGIGAGLQAYSMTGGEKVGAAGSLVLLDVTGVRIGLGVAGGFVESIVPRNSPIPCRYKKRFTTASDYQTKVELQIFEGERPEVINCNKLGSFNLDGIPPMSAGVAQIDVEFYIDSSGILNVTATEMSTGKSAMESSISVRNTSTSKIEQMLREAEQFREQDEIKKQAYETKRELEGYARNMKNALLSEHVKSKVPESKYRSAMEAVERTIKWCNTISSENLTRELCDEKHSSLRQIVEPILGEATGDTDRDQQQDYAFDPSKRPTYGGATEEQQTQREDL